jgi:hypothetical protein
LVLADRFPASVVPRWLDEGAAVLAEPHDKRARRRTADFDSAPILTFRAGEILTADEYPAGPARHAFYSESQELVSLLLRRGDAPRLLAFAHEAASGAKDAALREHYGLSNMLALDALRAEELSPPKVKAGLVIEASYSVPR